MRVGDHRTFFKVNEVLAVERDHPATLRETGMDALLAELETVRTRYVTLEGKRHAAAMRRHRDRERVLKRFYWIAFMLQTTVPTRFRRGPWSRFLATGTTRLVLPQAILILLPRQGDIRDQVMAPSKFWLTRA